MQTNAEKYQLISNVDNDNDDNDKSDDNTNKCREMQRIEWEMKGNINRFAMLTMLRNEEELQTVKETVREGTMHALPAVNVNFHFCTFPPSRWPVSLWYRTNDMSTKTKGFVGGLFRMAKRGPDH